MYSEKGPVIETPLSAADSLHNMMLQGHRGVIKLFPAVPSSWDDIEFTSFAAPGGFRISAKRVGGKTVYLHVHSTKKGSLNIQTSFQGPFYSYRKSLKKLEEKEFFSADMEENEDIIFKQD